MGISDLRRDRDEEFGALAGVGIDFNHTAQRLEFFAHSEKPQTVPLGIILYRTGVKSHPIVGDGALHGLAITSQPNPYRDGLRVFADVIERLLNYTVEGRLNRCRKPPRVG